MEKMEVVEMVDMGKIGLEMKKLQREIRDFKKVYVVVSADQERFGVFIEGIFTTKEEAEEFAKMISGKYTEDEFFVFEEDVYRTAEEAIDKVMEE